MNPLNQFAGICSVVSEPQHTRNLFGSVADIAGKQLKVLERNEEGDCLALLPDGSNLVDVDGRDVQAFVKFNARDPLDALMQLGREMSAGVKPN